MNPGMTRKLTDVQVLEILAAEARTAGAPGSSRQLVALTRPWLRGSVPIRPKRSMPRVAQEDTPTAPSADDGTHRFMSDQALGNEDETRVQCPRCNGQGETEERTENVTGYSIRHAVCWLCRGNRMVSPVACVEFRSWAGRKHE